MKKFESYTFNELTAWACWEFIQHLCGGGMSLSSVMHIICDQTIRWYIAQEKKRVAREAKKK